MSHHDSIVSLLDTRSIYLRGVYTWHQLEDSFSSQFSPLLCGSQKLNLAIRLGNERFHLLSHTASPATAYSLQLLVLFYHTCHTSQSFFRPDQVPGSAPSTKLLPGHLECGCYNIFHKTSVLEQQKWISFWLEEARSLPWSSQRIRWQSLVLASAGFSWPLDFLGWRLLHSNFRLHLYI